MIPLLLFAEFSVGKLDKYSSLDGSVSELKCHGVFNSLAAFDNSLEFQVSKDSV